MTNPWKIATIGLALTGVTAAASGLTTAWMLRPATAGLEPPQTMTAPPAVRTAALTTAPRPPATYTTAARPAPAPVPVTRVSTASAPAAAECSTGGERAMRIAKPGAIGALLGAGLGAAGGAIADGGKSAGKGALIGGLAGAALGAGYGAYKTKNECGTIFGNGAGFAGGGGSFTGGSATTQAFRPANHGDRITVYGVR